MTLVKNILNRSAYTIFANGLRSLFNFLAAIFLARMLGPSDFGLMSFVIASFVALRSLVDLGFSSAFYTFISESKNILNLSLTYLIILFIQFLLPLLIIFYLFPESLTLFLWKDANTLLIFFGYIAIFAQYYLWNFVLSIAEALRFTIYIQSVWLLVSIINLLVIFIFSFLNLLTINNILILIFLEYTFASVLSIVFLIATVKYKETNNFTFQPLFKKFYNYSFPLFQYSLIGFIAIFFDRWVLQSYGGSLEQGYYSISFQISAISLIATSSILKIFWKEIAEAKSKKNTKFVQTLFLNVSKILYLISCFIFGFLFYWSEEIINIILGTKYIGGISTFMILLLYPLHQSLGQISTSFLYATSKTKLLARINSFFLVLGMMVSFILIVPNNFFLEGMSMGSNGLAIKMIIIQFLNVNLLIFYISKLNNWRFNWFYQFSYIFVTLCIGFFSKVIAILIFESNLDMFILYAFIYLALFILILYKIPKIFSFSKDDYYQLARSI